GVGDVRRARRRRPRRHRLLRPRRGRTAAGQGDLLAGLRPVRRRGPRALPRVRRRVPGPAARLAAAGRGARRPARHGRGRGVHPLAAGQPGVHPGGRADDLGLPEGDGRHPDGPRRARTAVRGADRRPDGDRGGRQAGRAGSRRVRGAEGRGVLVHGRRHPPHAVDRHALRRADAAGRGEGRPRRPSGGGGAPEPRPGPGARAEHEHGRASPDELRGGRGGPPMTRTALVTGAAGGLGALAARRLAAAAWDVVAVDADAEGLARTALRSPNMHVRTGDVTDPGAVADVVAMAGSVQRVVHASAVPPAGPTLEQPPDEVERALRTGVLGAVNVVRATLPGMLERGSGELILCPAHPEPDVPDGPAPASMTTASMTTASMATGSMITAAVAAYADALFAEHGGRGVTIRCCAAPPGVAPRLVLDAVDRSLARPAAEVRVTPAPGLRRLLPARAARGAAAGGFAPR